MHHTILLVEDDPNDVLLIQRAFRKANLANAVQVVGDGEAAIVYLAGEGPYADRERYPLPMLILLDLKLPRKSGLEVLIWLRRRPELKHLPVVVLSPSHETPDMSRANDLGANFYISKPLSFEALSDMVKALQLCWLLVDDMPVGYNK